MRCKRGKQNKTFNGAAAVAAVLFLFIVFVVFSSKGASARYVSDIKQAVDLVINPTKPVFAAQGNWYRAKTPKTSIAAVIFEEHDYEPESEPTESFYADANNKGTIKCYVVESVSGPAVIISGNGWDNGEWNDDCSIVYANSNGSNMFRDFSSLQTVKGANYMDVSGTTRLSTMFFGCNALTGIDISSWSVGNVTDMSSMFNGCSSLESVGDLSSWNTGKVAYFTSLFASCSSLKELKLTNWDLSSSASGQMNMLSGCIGLEKLDVSNWKLPSSPLLSVDCSYMFRGFSKLEALDLSGWDMSRVKSTQGMFASCTNLKSVGDLSGWNTSNITVMTSMFASCSNLEAVGDLSEWDTSSVTDVTNLFNACPSLVELNLSGWDLSSVNTGKINMFGGCTGLTSLDVSDWTLPVSVQLDLSRMFMNCVNLTELDLGNWDTSAVVNTEAMFATQSKLVSVGDLSSWNTSNITNMSSMFSGCSSLTELNLRGWDTSSVTSMYNMFNGCTSLEKIYASSKFTAADVTNISGTFNSCGKLVGEHGTSFSAMAIADRSNYTTAKYACVDTTNHPGYFCGDTVTLTYHANGGEGDDHVQYVLPSIEDNLIDISYTRTGYHFAGWSTEEEGAADYSASGDEKIYASFADDTDLYAVWEANVYTVSFDAQGGIVSPASMQLTYDGIYEGLPVPTRKGYVFKGWNISGVPAGFSELEYLKSTGTQYIDTGFSVSSGNMRNMRIDVVETFDTYSGWQVDGIGTVEPFIYVGQNGGNFAYGGGSADQKTNISIPRNTPSALYVDYKNGVAGCNDNETKITLSNPSVNTPQNLWLFRWAPSGSFHSAQKYSVKIWENGNLKRDLIPAVWNGGETTYSKNGTVYTQSLASNTAGLYDKVHSVFYINSGTGVFTQGPACGSGNLLTESSVVNTACDHTLFAVWEADPVTIRFKANGADAEDSVMTVLRDTENTLDKNSFRREGYNFTGWNTAADGSGESYADQANVVFSCDTVLYAQWEVKSGRVSFDARGGIVDTTWAAVTYGTPYGELPVPVKDGYTFVGWSPSRLPVGYIELEYIENSGGAYIDTGYRIKNKNNFSYEIDMMPASGENNACECGCGNSSAWSGQRWSGDYYILGGNVAMKGGIKRQAGVREYFKASVDGNNVSMSRTANGNTVTQDFTQSGSCATNRNWLLFGYTFNGDTASGAWSGKIYSHKLYDGGELVLDLIPCKKESGEVGMFNTVTGDFFQKAKASGILTGAERTDIICSESIVNIEDSHVLHAVWKINDHVLELDLGGGSIDADGWTLNEYGNSEKLFAEDTVAALPVPVRDGYIFKGWKLSSLAEGYTTLEYIENSGSAYIDTGYCLKNSNDFKYEIDMIPSSGETTSCECGCGNDNAWSGQRWGGQYYILGSSINLNDVMKRKAGVRELFTASVSGSAVSLSRAVGEDTYSQSFTMNGSCATDRHWLVFAYDFKNNGPSGNWTGKIYSHRLYDGGELVLDLVPCKNSEGTIGMYNRVSNEFFSEKGGKLTPGTELNTNSSVLNDDGTVTIKDMRLCLSAVWEKTSEE